LGILDIDLFTSTFVLWYYIDYKDQAKLKLYYGATQAVFLGCFI
jgi:hypothetical protein